MSQFADVNGDGKADLISQDANGGISRTIWIHPSEGAGSFGPATAVLMGDTAWYRSMADVNGDGRADIIAATEGGGHAVKTFLASASGTFASSVSSTGDGYFYAMADINGDGRADYVTKDTPVVSQPHHTLYVHFANANGSFGVS